MDSMYWRRSELVDMSLYRGALVEFDYSGISNHRAAFAERNSLYLLKEVREEIKSNASILWEHFADHIYSECEDIGCFCGETDDAFNVEDWYIEDLWAFLDGLFDHRLAEMERAGDVYASIQGGWEEFVEEVNSTFADQEAWFAMVFEGTLPELMRELFDRTVQKAARFTHEGPPFWKRPAAVGRAPYQCDTKYVGQLAVVANFGPSQWAAMTPPLAMEVRRLIHEFNDRECSC
jgi:hypothetical protein